jgi:hypothetical protein
MSTKRAQLEALLVANGLEPISKEAARLDSAPLDSQVKQKAPENFRGFLVSKAYLVCPFAQEAHRRAGAVSASGGDDLVAKQLILNFERTRRGA